MFIIIICFIWRLIFAKFEQIYVKAQPSKTFPASEHGRHEKLQAEAKMQTLVL